MVSLSTETSFLNDRKIVLVDVQFLITLRDVFTDASTLKDGERFYFKDSSIEVLKMLLRMISCSLTIEES